MAKVKLSDLSTEELAELTRLHAEKLAKERKEMAEKRKEYEKNRESRIKKAFSMVSKIEKMMVDFKEMLAVDMENQHKELDEFGEIVTNSKGGFSVTSKDGTLRITRTRDTDPKWDETAHKGADLIKQFLVAEGAETSRPGIFNLLMGFLSKNEAGELEYAKVMSFLRHENEFDDPRWVEGLRLIKEGYSIEFKKFGYIFSMKDKEGKFKPISINFTKL